MSPTPQNRPPITFDEIDRHLEQLLREWDKTNGGLGILAVTLGEKGFERAHDEIVQGALAIAAEYRQREQGTLGDLFCLIDQYKHYHTLEKCPLPVQKKIREALAIKSEKNQKLFALYAEHAARYDLDDIKTLPDVPLTEEGRKKQLGYLGLSITPLSGKCLPSPEDKEMQEIGRQFAALFEECLGLPAGSPADNPTRPRTKLR